MGNLVKPVIVPDEGHIRLRVGEDGQVEVVVDAEDTVELPGEPIKSSRGEVVAIFPAYVKTARISVGGELILTLGVPVAAKYSALAVTDQKGIVFEVEVRRPPRRRKRTEGGEVVEATLAESKKNGKGSGQSFDPWSLV